MSLLTAHKILICLAVALFILYALFEARNFVTGDSGGVVRALLSASAAVGLGLYLRSLFRASDERPPSVR